MTQAIRLASAVGVRICDERKPSSAQAQRNVGGWGVAGGEVSRLLTRAGYQG